ncbi:MAG: helix-turn-helix domain-containing protein [Eubacteriales bacterium]|jgi:transcriptional regulator with XRE-family HTH domain|nr:helix-turn-helix transcriptional regulator [Clostridiales bacterium]
MFKEKFVRLLQQRGISALKLAQETGIPKSVVYEWRSGKRLPSAENLAKLSRYFGVSLDELVGEQAPGSVPSPSSEEQDLILLLRAAREVSGSERDEIMEKFRRSMEKYLNETENSGSSKDARVRRGKNGASDKE